MEIADFIRSAEFALRNAQVRYVAMRKEIGFADRRPPYCDPELCRLRQCEARGRAFRAFNIAMRNLRAAERDLAQLQADLRAATARVIAFPVARPALPVAA